MDKNSVIMQAVQPVRQMQSGLNQVSQMVHAMGDEAGFMRLLSQLSSLPSAATFAPLQAASRLPVDIPEAAREEAPSVDGGRQQFLRDMLQGARGRGVDAPPTASPRPSRPARVVSAIQAPATALRADSGTATQVGVGVGSTVVSSVASSPLSRQGGQAGGTSPDMGSWVMLERMAQLVAELGQSSARQGQTALPMGQQEAVPQPLAGGRAPLSRLATSDLAPVLGSDPPRPPMQADLQAQKAPPRFAASAAGTSPLTLDSLVQSWWSAANRSPGSASASTAPPASRTAQDAPASAAAALRTTAPRAMSVLQPQLSQTGRVAASRTDALAAGSANDSVAPGASTGRIVPPFAAGATVAMPDDEALADQLNRALVEQAWRAGVDLT
jgi:hypothetical protein